MELLHMYPQDISRPCCFLVTLVYESDVSYDCEVQEPSLN